MAVARHSENIEVQDEDQDDTNYENESTITARRTKVEMSEGHYESLDLQKIDDAVYEDLRAKTRKDKGLPKKIQQSGRRPFIVVAVCLGMLCLISLGVNIALAVLYYRSPCSNVHDNADKSSCSSGWRTFEDSCYYITTGRKTWQEGRDYCLTQGADLVVINSREEQEFIRGWSPDGYASWIGLTRTHREGGWTWVDGTPLTTQYWYRGRGYPLDNEDRNCAAYLGYTDTETWINVLCSSTRVSICETEK